MNQKLLWNDIYLNRKISQNKSEFVDEVLKSINTNSMILELGCGHGFDALELSKTNKVTAIDFSQKAIAEAKLLANKNLFFEVGDFAKPLKYKSGEFDLVYSRLSLHYFDDKTTKSIISEVSRVLAINGRFAFMVKSTKDELFGKGIKKGENIFELDGHIRHFFSKKYIKELLKNVFEIKTISEESGRLYDQKSTFIKVISVKR